MFKAWHHQVLSACRFPFYGPLRRKRCGSPPQNLTSERPMRAGRPCPGRRRRARRSDPIRRRVPMIVIIITCIRDST
eukprot:68520-Hanusia_phi.AAC.1